MFKMTAKRVNTSATARLKQDYLKITRDPIPYIKATPMATNILEWHYVVCGPEDSIYAGGIYHGKLVFPSEYPFKPPSVYMITPNGRFKCNTRLCLSISDFHPDTWNPTWSVSTILKGLLSFMLEKTPTMGSLETSDHTKRQFAYFSGAFNLKNEIFCELFPEIVEEIKNDLKKQAAAQAANEGGIIVNGTQPIGEQNLAADGNGSLFHSALTNVFIILGFAAFAYTVKYVLTNIVE